MMKFAYRVINNSLKVALAIWVLAAQFSNIAVADEGTQAHGVDESRLRELIREEIARALKSQSKTGDDTSNGLSSAIRSELASEVEKTEAKPRINYGSKPDSVDLDPHYTQVKRKGRKIPFEFDLSGYGDIRYSFYDYDESVNRPEGSRNSSRTAFDLTRFVTKLEAEYEPAGIEIEAEVEFEHGGTGSAKELEFEEFGEFENDVENGGEILVEELYVKKEFDDWTVRAGRFYVGVGLLSDYYTPLDYLATARSETETTLLPAVWDEIGISVERKFSNSKLTMQVVNGLDSSGFGSSRWIATGHQEKFEVNKADDLAYVLRYDFNVHENWLVGGSAYYADSTSGNRPRDDLDVDGDVLLVSGHTAYIGERLSARGMALWGALGDAAEISERNSRLSNNLGVERTPVAEEALGVWGELGYDVAPWLDVSAIHRVEPFFRLDYYDSFYKAAPGTFDNPKFERFVYTPGLAYTYMNSITAKFDWSLREYGGSGIGNQNTARFSIGFIF